MLMQVLVQTCTNGGEYGGDVLYDRVVRIETDNDGIVLVCEPNAGIESHTVHLTPRIHQIVDVQPILSN